MSGGRTQFFRFVGTSRDPFLHPLLARGQLWSFSEGLMWDLQKVEP